MGMSALVRVWQIGRSGYLKTLRLQKAIVDRQRDAGDQCENTLIMVEHDPVYTVGIRSKEYTNEDERRLRTLGAEFHWSDRGGLITFHGPGQLVIYPILSLGQLFDKKGPVGLRRYVEKLQSAAASTCLLLGLDGCRTMGEFPGVWVGAVGEERKVCAVGVRARRSIVSHGLSLNCSVDLSWFDHIVPCGIRGKGVTSLSKELQTKVSVKDASPVFLSAFSKEFNCQICDFPVPLANSLYSSLD